MGLDVYAYKYADRAKTKKLEAKYEKESEKIWAKYPGEYKDLTEAQKEEARKLTKALSLSLGLGEGGYDSSGKLEIASKKHPKHMFKIGYLRSSYNGGGFNSVMQQFIGRDLYSIFQPPEHEYEFQPYWLGAKATAEDMLKEFTAKVKDNPFRVMEIDAYRGDYGVKSEQDALAKFIEEHTKYVEKKDKFMSAYSSGAGTFYMDKPLPVVGIVTGLSNGFMSKGKPTYYIVYKDEMKWYKEALEVTIEMIDYALASPDKDKIWLSWSS